jgi:hypothetical protein
MYGGLFGVAAIQAVVGASTLAEVVSNLASDASSASVAAARSPATIASASEGGM